MSAGSNACMVLFYRQFWDSPPTLERVPKSWAFGNSLVARAVRGFAAAFLGDGSIPEDPVAIYKNKFYAKRIGSGSLCSPVKVCRPGISA